MNKRLYNKRSEIFRITLKFIRKHYGVSQEKLACKLGVSQSYVSKTETDKRKLDVLELLEYCNAIGLTLTEFIFRLEYRLHNEKLLPAERRKDILIWSRLFEEYNKQRRDSNLAKSK